MPKTVKPTLQIDKFNTYNEEKENSATFLNKMKTPTMKVGDKEKKSPSAVFKRNKEAKEGKEGKEGSNIKAKKSEDSCLTPKAKNTLSNLKQKSEISVKKDKTS